MNLIKSMETDVEFGQQIMQAAGIRICRPAVEAQGGLKIHVMTWFSKGQQVGPVFSFFKGESAIKLIWPYRIREPRIYQSTLKKALPIIKQSGHSGIVSLELLIGAHDGKAYGIAWTTGLYQYILTALKPLLKVGMAEWIRWIYDGCEGGWVQYEFYYSYAGTVVDDLTDVNGKLIGFKALGYELPLNLEDPQTLVSEASDVQPCESAQFHQL